MAIALDGAVVSFKYATSSTSFTVSNNSNRLLLVSYGTYQGAGPSAVSYNGVALTKIVEKVGSFSEQCSIWGLLSPDVGTATLSVSGMGNWSAVGIYSLYGVDQSSLPTNTATNGGASSSASVAVTTASDNSWVIASIEAEPTITISTSGGTEDWNQQGQSFQNAEGQRILKATAGSQTMSANLSYGARWNACAIEVKEAATNVVFNKNLLGLLGVS